MTAPQPQPGDPAGDLQADVDDLDGDSRTDSPQDDGRDGQDGQDRTTANREAAKYRARLREVDSRP